MIKFPLANNKLNFETWKSHLMEKVMKKFPIAQNLKYTNKLKFTPAILTYSSPRICSSEVRTHLFDLISEIWENLYRGI